MIKVKVSPKYQVVIPQKVRDLCVIEVGEQLQVFPYQNRIEMIPIKSIKSMRGFLQGIDTTIDREKDRV